jgi:hypothetical protein
MRRPLPTMPKGQAAYDSLCEKDRIESLSVQYSETDCRLARFKIGNLPNVVAEKLLETSKCVRKVLRFDLAQSRSLEISLMLLPTMVSKSLENFRQSSTERNGECQSFFVKAARLVKISHGIFSCTTSTVLKRNSF